MTGVGCTSAVGSVCPTPCPVSAARYYPGGFQSVRGMMFRGAGQEMCCPVVKNDRNYCVGFVDSGTAAAPSCCQTKAAAMNLADVVALSSSGVSDEVIINQIHTTSVHFTLSTEDILWLKKNKVSDQVVMQMQHTRPAPAPSVVATPVPAPAYPPLPYAPVQYFPLPTIQHVPQYYAPTSLPQPCPTTVPNLKLTQPAPPPAPSTPMSSLTPSQPFTYWPTVNGESVGPKPISLDFAFPYPLVDVIGSSVNSDAGMSGSIIINERNFDSKRSQSQQAGEIGEKLLDATAELIGGVAGFVGEELPAILSDAGESVRPKVKLTVGFKLERK
jgi:hypothetical protein